MKALKIQHKIALGVSAAIAIAYAVAKIRAFKNAKVVEEQPYS
ncbi:MAG TPA: hypothetical protein VK718_01820 [Ferruginibacter sp.]|jgi:hypothetical protein|nr:hypothetical protein [Ferruginibacter sp.]